MESAMSRSLRLVASLVAVIAVLLLFVQARYGRGDRLEDRTTAPELPASALEVVANLDHPPGNIAVSADGRVLFTFHPDAKPPIKVAELKDGKPVPYPDAAFQEPSTTEPHFQSPLAVRIDQQGRFWVLDYADYARGQPRITAFDLATNELVHRYDFPADVAGLGSMLNDFQVDARGERIYIAEASPILHTPALIVYDVVKQKSRRLLEGDPSIQAKPFILQAPGRDMVIFGGLYALRIPIDSIALERTGEWLYYGPLSGDRMYRIRTRDLDDANLSPADLSARIEDYGPKTISDGLTTDDAGNVYVSDPEHSAILTLTPERKLRTLLEEERLRWPDGFSFGPGGWLYVTCSSLQDVLFVSQQRMRDNAPYQIFRFKPGPSAVPGQ
jgi:sugar lactone lactonase YvrE